MVYKTIRLVIIILFVIILSSVVYGATVVVNNTSPGCTTGDIYSNTVQGGVDSSSDGDNVLVCPAGGSGRYTENIMVNKSINLTAYQYGVVINASNSSRVIINVTSHGVNITNFTIRDTVACSTIFPEAIALSKVNSSVISNNFITNTCQSITLYNTDFSTIHNNIVTTTNGYGIYLLGSRDNRVINNIVNGTPGFAYLQNTYPFSSTRNEFISNRAKGAGYSYYFVSTTNTNVSYSILESISGQGFFLSGVSSSNFSHNILIGGTSAGIYLSGSNTIDIYNNTINNSAYGIYIDNGVTKVRFYNNTIYNNSLAGIFSSSGTNLIFNNNIYNHESGFRAGIYLTGSGAANNTIYNNNLNTNNRHSILITNANNTNITGNTISTLSLGVSCHNNLTNNIFIGGIVNSTFDCPQRIEYVNSFGRILWAGLTNISIYSNLYPGNNLHLQNNLLGLADLSTLSRWNNSASIEIRGLAYSGTPKLLKDGVRCDLIPSLCNTTYDVGAGILYADVSSFSNYTTSSPGTPLIYNVASVTNTTGATITWDTDIPANSTVIYSNDTGMFPNLSISDSDFEVSHSISLLNLSEDTTYYYLVFSCAAPANGSMCSTSSQFSFITTSSSSDYRNNGMWMVALILFLGIVCGILAFLFTQFDNLAYKLFLFFIVIGILTLGVSFIRIIIEDNSLVSASTAAKLTAHVDTLYLIMVTVMIVSAVYFFLYFTYKVGLWVVFIGRRKKL